MELDFDVICKDSTQSIGPKSFIKKWLIEIKSSYIISTYK